MQSLKIPVWLISLVSIVFIVVVLERLYVAKVPVKIWGIELNQPSDTISDLLKKPLSIEWNNLFAGYKETKKIVLGSTDDYIYWSLSGNRIYRHGENKGGGLTCRVFIENEAWVLQAIGGTHDIDKDKGTTSINCYVVGLKKATG